jgi:DNA-binding LacI/PurR family transcriptional regulator
LLKEEYTTLKINHDKLMLTYDLLYNDIHDTSNNVVKVDIATSCYDLIVESIEQGSSRKGKQVVVAKSYDDYVKVKNENEKLKKDIEKLSINGTIIIEKQDDDYDMALEKDMLK